MSERFEFNIDLGNGKGLEIEVDRDNDICILMDDGDDRVQAWIKPRLAREIGIALIRAAIDAEDALKLRTANYGEGV